jgi:hypothetical protein
LVAVAALFVAISSEHHPRQILGGIAAPAIFACIIFIPWREMFPGTGVFIGEPNWLTRYDALLSPILAIALFLLALVPWRTVFGPAPAAGATQTTTAPSSAANDAKSGAELPQAQTKPDAADTGPLAMG